MLQLLVNITDVRLDDLDVLDIAKEGIGIDQIFVNHIEVRDKHIAPEVEAVKLLVGVVLDVDLV